MASSTTGLTSELLANEIGTSDEADYCDEASGSTKICDGKIDGASDGEIDVVERTYLAPKRFSISEMETMMMDVDTAQIPTRSVSSGGKRKFSALCNDTTGISLLSSDPTATSNVTTSERAGKK